MNINRKISKYNFNKGSVSRIKYIVIHYVGALGGAEDNCRYYGGGKPNCSGMKNPKSIPLSQAKKKYTACKKCCK